MKKRIKKWGDSLVIVFNKDEVSLYGLREGDVIELDDMILENKKRVNKIIKEIKK